MANIILSTLNARYFHSSLGLRYLMANMGDMQQHTKIKEFIIDSRPLDIVEILLADNPSIIGFSVYIWNVEALTRVVSLIKQIKPEIIIILGGPEISFETHEQEIAKFADYIISGPADIEFGELCRRLIKSASIGSQTPATKLITAQHPTPEQLTLPYDFYTDHDISHRILYVEASRGCPYKCEFCLSALDKTVTPFNLDAFLSAMQKLYDRGARQFKFVDRTFNLKIETSINILNFFLERLSDDLFLHFELIPDHLPEKLKHVISLFPPGTLQFEIGIQSFNPQIQENIRRKQNNTKSIENLRWLREHSHAHLHTDLIIGLPGEDVESFAAGFDQLVQLDPHEIQVGILKRLRGTPINRHTDSHGMVYNPQPPYNILKTNRIEFQTMQRLTRFARYWDLIANSGRFKNSLRHILAANPFNNFLNLSDWIFNQTRQTHQIALDRLFELLCEGSIKMLNIPETTIQHSLYQDYMLTGLRKTPPRFINADNAALLIPDQGSQHSRPRKNPLPKRQARHLQ